jgi:glucosyl-dolichyl phosphate glucuronosyltransferase
MSLSIAVIICAYTEDRWDELLKAVQSVESQSLSPVEIIISIDHSSNLFQRATRQFPSHTVIENSGMKGLSGARNSALAVARAEILVFMDEDAWAQPHWLELLHQEFQSSEVMGAGGGILPQWEQGRPGWFPEEFDWVVGCTYKGMPVDRKPIRNLIGCNMAFRKQIFDVVGGFREGVGRVDTLPFGCEETELCIRARQQWPAKSFMYQPTAEVFHHVPSSRARLSYFVSRCYAEGLSKAQVTDYVGSQDGLSSERAYVLRTLSHAVWKNVRSVFSRNGSHGLARAGAILLGLGVTTCGYILGKLRTRRQVTDYSSPLLKSAEK